MANSSDLPIREMILGVLKSKDIQGTNRIHASDFRAAITDLGFSMGSATVENILIFCKLDSSGNMDFTDLERELARERRVVSAKKKTEPKMTASSNGVTSKPWRADVVHRAKVDSERQLLTVQEHGPEVNQLYGSLSHHEISPSNAIYALQDMGILPTKAFMKLVQTMAYAEVSYSDFVRALTKFEPVNSDLNNKQVSAGGYTPKSSDIQDKDQQRRAVQGIKAIQQSVTDPLGQQPVVDNSSNRTNRHMMNSSGGGSSYQTIFQAQGAKDTIFGGSQGVPVPLLSQSQADLLRPLKSSEDIAIDDGSLAFNSELRLQREQVYAALRKLDGGRLSMADFQDLLFSLNVDLPEALLGELRRAVAAGRMDIRRIMHALDGTIFKQTAIETQAGPQAMQSLLARLRQAARDMGGMDALANLALLFKRMDSDGDGLLTFTEFTRGLSSLLSFGDGSDDGDPEDDLRKLFHGLDIDGDGTLSSDELLLAITGPLSPVRRAAVQRAFKQLDRTNRGAVSVETVVDSFLADRHPLVVQGVKRAREITTALVHWLSSHAAPDRNGEMLVPYSAFELYFAAVSVAVDDDNVFSQLLMDCFDLHPDLQPAPPLSTLRQGAMASAAAPMAIQSHGDMIGWQQEPSLIEAEGAASRQRATRRAAPEGKMRNASSFEIGRRGEDEVKAASHQQELLQARLTKSRKNLTSRPALLAWQSPGAVKSQQQQASSSSSSSSSQQQQQQSSSSSSDSNGTMPSLAYQEDYAIAGGSSSKGGNSGSRGTAVSSFMARDYHSGGIPFGVDPGAVNDSSKATVGGGSNSSGGVRSLADALKSSKGSSAASGGSGSGSGSGSAPPQPRSLADFAKNRF